MKKILVILVLSLTFPMLALGQLQIRTHGDKISDFTSKITKVVLTGNDSLDVPIREAMKDFWTITAYEICSREDFDALKKDEKYYFLAVDKGRDGIRNWRLVKGGSDKSLASMVTVAELPICPADGYTGREYYLLPALVCHMQHLAAKAVGSKYKGAGKAVSTPKEAAALPIYICSDEITPDAELIQKDLMAAKRMFLVSESDADGTFMDGLAAAVCFVVKPLNPRKGQLFFVYLVDTVTNELYYYKKHKVSSDAGLLKEDIKAFAKGR